MEGVPKFNKNVSKACGKDGKCDPKKMEKWWNSLSEKERARLASKSGICPCAFDTPQAKTKKKKKKKKGRRKK